jgi:hypothetical protein
MSFDACRSTPTLGDKGCAPRELGLVRFEPDAERLVAHVKPRTSWDS